MPEKPTEQSSLITAAKTIGQALGKVAAAAGAHPTEDRPLHEGGQAQPRRHTGKLPRKNKSRLPRRQKKALKRQHFPQANG